MTAPRANQISLIDTKYYHCISRCVRQSFLCGKDTTSGRSFEHRRQWIEDKLIFLASVFCIDICAFSIMNNHYHVIFHVDNDKAQKLSNEEVLLRWRKLFKCTLITKKYLAKEELNHSEIISLEQTVAEYRKRLFSISWFMKVMNESISRKANKEDGCKGYFWSGRFKSQALLDEAALAACMAYVDLNPVRAKIAKTPETSNHTSIQKRINSAYNLTQPSFLLPFVGGCRNSMPKGLPFYLKDYVELVELSGRCICQNKRGYITEDTVILARLGISSENWIKLTMQFSQIFHGAVGREDMLDNYCNHLKRQKRINLTSCRRYFS